MKFEVSEELASRWTSTPVSYQPGALFFFGGGGGRGGGEEGVNCLVVFPTHFNPKNFLLLLLQCQISLRLNTIFPSDASRLVFDIPKVFIEDLASSGFCENKGLGTQRSNAKIQRHFRSSAPRTLQGFEEKTCKTSVEKCYENSTVRENYKLGGL